MLHSKLPPTRLHRTLLHSLALACLGSAMLAACSDDDDDSSPPDDGTAGSRAGTPSRGGSPSQDGGATNRAGSASGEGGFAMGGEAGAEAAGGSGASGGGADDGGAGGVDQSGAGAAGDGGANGTDRYAFRPEELPFDQERFEALRMPAGFTINVYRSGLGQARMLGVHGPHVYVTQPMQGNVVQLIDDDDDGTAESQRVVADGLPMVHGIAFAQDSVFLANVHSVFRAEIASDGSFGELTEIIDDLPDGGQHALRTLGVGPDNLLYISVGSDCDACVEANPEHATLLRSTLAGQAAPERTIYARGLRNTIGFGWHPLTDQLWGMDHGSDWRGNDLPPEELNLIQSGKNYGWPYCFADRAPDPVIQDPPDRTKAEYCATTEPAVLLNQAHQAPIGFVFYAGSTFPDRYQDGAFVALRGSWNRKPATGYRIAFIAFEAGQPQGIEDFVSGFLAEDGQSTFGRPAGINVAPDGSVLFTDDTNGIVYRVQHY